MNGWFQKSTTFGQGQAWLIFQNGVKWGGVGFIKGAPTMILILLLYAIVLYPFKLMGLIHFGKGDD